MASQSIERAAVLLKAGPKCSEVDVTAALNEARRAIIVTHDEIGDNSRGLIEAFDAAIAIVQSGRAGRVTARARVTGAPGVTA